MHPSRRYCLWASLAALLCVLAPSRASAETFTITSTPPGATVEIDGVVVGTTPYRTEYPGGYFHKTHTIFGTILEHEMKARIYKAGFTSRDIVLTEGPSPWTNLEGRVLAHYYLIKQKQISVTLDALGHVMDGSIRVGAVGGQQIGLAPELPIERIVEIARPAIVELSDQEKAGTGFLVTSTGVIATNKHVVEGDASVTVRTSTGQELQGSVVYVDDQVDLALVKIDGAGYPFLPLSDGSGVEIGQTVIAIGNPAQGMSGTVTRGIISGIGAKPEEGAGTWIQTDAAINPGNSGGPLINARGEVVAVSTRKHYTAHGTAEPSDQPLQGIGFALSSTDLLAILRRFYPEPFSASDKTEMGGEGKLRISSETDGTEIYIDGSFVGQTPSVIPLPSGQHRIEVRSQGGRIWVRDLKITSGSEITLRATFAPGDLDQGTRDRPSSPSPEVNKSP